MMTLPGHIKEVYFLGIGGIGMSALARWFKAYGIKVSGYDRTPSRITRELQEEGIAIHFEDDPALIPQGLDLAVYTPAIQPDLKELAQLKASAVRLLKRSEVLGLISRDLFTIAIGGTHGKTSISSLCAWILKESNQAVNAFIGGISKNFDSNLILDKSAKFLIAEADEYDRSFLSLHPDVALISAMDADHLDIYGNKEEMFEAYRAFANLCSSQGFFIRNIQVPKLQVRAKSLTYGLDAAADFSATDIQVSGFEMSFTLHTPMGQTCDLILGIPGRHNLENALAACAVCMSIGIQAEQIKQALRTYRGVERRFDLRVAMSHSIYLDDYAHHPEEIKACIQAVREVFPGKRITGIFQPHLYSRTRDFADAFASSLDSLDEIILMEIYPARELPIPGVDSGMIARRMHNKNHKILTRSEILEHIDMNQPELILTMGAGDIDRLVPDIEILLKRKAPLPR